MSKKKIILIFIIIFIVIVVFICIFLINWNFKKNFNEGKYLSDKIEYSEKPTTNYVEKVMLEIISIQGEKVTEEENQYLFYSSKDSKESYIFIYKEQIKGV